MNKDLNPKAGFENLQCDLCEMITVYTCSKCLGDYCDRHIEHGKGHF